MKRLISIICVITMLTTLFTSFGVVNASSAPTFSVGAVEAIEKGDGTVDVAVPINFSGSASVTSLELEVAYDKAMTFTAFTAGGLDKIMEPATGKNPVVLVVGEYPAVEIKEGTICTLTFTVPVSEVKEFPIELNLTQFEDADCEDIMDTIATVNGKIVVEEKGGVTTPTFSVGEFKVDASTENVTVDVPVVFSGSASVTSLELEVAYDEAITFTAFTAGGLDKIMEPATGKNPVVLVVGEYPAVEIKEGTICTLTFSVPATEAKEFPIELNLTQFEDADCEDIMDTIATVNGKIIVEGSAVPPVVDVANITLDKTSATLTEGETVELKATVTPDDATDPTVTWRTSDGKVATVVDGVVTAVAPGKATITAIAGGKEATCEITVNAKVIDVAGIALDKAAATLTEGETVELKATVTPDDATDKTVTWTTSNDKVATVVDGVVTAVAAGTATITAKAGSKSATCEITVNAKASAATPTFSVGEFKVDASTENVTVDVPVVFTGSASVTSLELEVAYDEAMTFTAFTAGGLDKIMEPATGKNPVVLVVGEYPAVEIKEGTICTLTFSVPATEAKEFPIELNLTQFEDADCEDIMDTIATVNGKIIVEGSAVPPVVDVAGIALDKSSATLTEGETVALTATVTPDNATDKTVTWTTSNDKVATVVDGVVTAVAAGSATITAKAGDKTATCEITVNAKAPAATPTFSVGEFKVDASTENVTVDVPVVFTGSASVTSLELEVAYDEAMTFTAFTAGGLDKIMEPATGKNPVVLVVGEYPAVEIKEGTICTLTFSVPTTEAKEFPIELNLTQFEDADCEDIMDTIATVNGKIVVEGSAVPPVVDVTGITLDKATAKVTEGETVELKATVEPDNATDKTVTWETSDAEVATVANGVVTTIKAGTVTITAKAGNFSATCVITVDAKVIPVAGIALDKETAKVTEGDKVTLVATVTPDDATDKTVTWETSDAEVATVVDGVVTTLKAGTVTITAKAGDKEATCVITVDAKVIPVTSITLDKATATLEVSKDLTLVATVEPADATDKTVTWETSDATIATVVDGKVVALKEGTVTITAKAGDKEATCVITVERLLGDINGDGAVALDDAIILFNYSMAEDLFPVDYAYTKDLNSDGSVSLSDAVLLFNYCIDAEQFPIAK